MNFFKKEMLAVKQLTSDSESLFKKESAKLLNKAVKVLLKYPGIELWVNIVGHVDHIEVSNSTKEHIQLRALPFNPEYFGFIEDHINAMPDKFKEAHAVIDKAVKLYKKGKRFTLTTEGHGKGAK